MRSYAFLAAATAIVVVATVQAGIALEQTGVLAHCHFGLGKLCRRTGQREQAREHLTTAATMYREMGMTFWLEHAEAVIGPPRGGSP